MIPSLIRQILQALVEEEELISGMGQWDQRELERQVSLHRAAHQKAFSVRGGRFSRGGSRQIYSGMHLMVKARLNQTGFVIIAP